MKRVVVTGASSFVGCHLVKAFAENGWAVAATLTRPFDAYDGVRAERLGWIRDSVSSWNVLDLRDGQAVRSFISDARPNLWIHHAGHAVNYGSADYDAAAGREVNVAPLAAIYEELAKVKAGVIVTGSSMEYADTDQACQETDACRPSTPYGASKLEETQAAEALSKQHGLPTRVARLFIPFGRFDAPNKVLPYVVDNLRQERPVDLSPCTQKRDFLAVGSVAKAYQVLADDLKRGGFEIVNVCSGQAVTVKSVIEGIAEQLGAPRALLGFGKRPMRPGEPDVSYGSCDKARKLGWRPASLDKGIAELVAGSVEFSADAIEALAQQIREKGDR